jgi:predicted HTH transcriptional regulator
VKASDLNPLLHRSESETLDFKRQQYPFAGATDEQKGELLKDIISIANAFKDSDGYILIGVEEEHGLAKCVWRRCDSL